MLVSLEANPQWITWITQRWRTVDFIPQVSFELRRVLKGDASYTDLEFRGESDRFTY